VHNPGAHGFTEILYEFSSAAANNGSGFEGLGDNTVPWNVATGVVMAAGPIHSDHSAPGHRGVLARRNRHRKPLAPCERTRFCSAW